MAHFGHHLVTALPAILLPFIRDDYTLSPNGLSYTQVAWVASAFSLSYGIGQMPGGWLADRFNRLIMIGVGVFGVSIVAILVGLSTSYLTLILLLVLMGLVGGSYHPAATPWIAASAGEKNQGRAMGFHFVGGGAGFFVAPFIAGAIAGVWGWRYAFIFMAIPCAIFGIVFFILLRRQRNTNQLRSVHESHHGRAGADKDHWRPLTALILMSLLTGGMGSVMTFFSLYLVDQFKVANETAVFIVAIASFAGIWAGPVGGWISDHIGRLPIILVTHLIGGIFIFVLRFIPFGAGIFALLLLSGTNNYMRAPVSEAFIIGHTSTRHRSLIYGIYYMVGQSSALFAPLMGFLIQHISYHTTFTIAGSIMVITTIICGSLLWGMRREFSPVPQASTD